MRSAFSAAVTRALPQNVEIVDETRRVLEIGGLTASIDHDLYFSGVQVDNVIRSSDGAAFRSDLAWQTGGGEVDSSLKGRDDCLAAGSPDNNENPSSCPLYFGGVRLGTHYFTHASDLSFAASSSYSMIFSSHSLEHIPNPLKALLEWDRVLAPGGHMVLILPWPDGTYDSPRERHDMLHLVQDFLDPSDSRLMQFHFEAIARGTDFDVLNPVDPVLGKQNFVGDLENARRTNKAFWEDDVHWHVFSFGLIEEIFYCLGYDVLALDLLEPYHMMAVGRKKD